MLNFDDTFPISDTLIKVKSPERFIENIDDTLILASIFDKAHTLRFIENIVDGLALGDTFITNIQRLFTMDFDNDVLTLSDILDTTSTQRSEIDVDDVLNILDIFSSVTNDRFIEDIAEALILIDQLTKTFTARTVGNKDEVVALSDELQIQYGLIVNGGTGSGNYNVNDAVVISATVPFNNIFIKWVFNKSGIDNIYSPSAILRMPLGGGVIAAIFLDLGTIEVQFVDSVVILTLDNYTYVESIDGDRIDTSETTKLAGSSMAVAKHNFTIEQGSVFSHIIIYRDANSNPVNLTGYTAILQIRKTKEASFIIQELSTTNGYLTLGGNNGTIILNIPSDITHALNFEWGFYDLELYPSGDTTRAIRLLEGKINLNKQVTR